MIKYLRYTLMHLTLLAVIVSIFAGGPWILVTGAVAGAFLFLGDHFMGDYLDEPEYAHPGILNALLYLVLPLLAAGSLAQAWMLGSGDFLGIGTAIQNMTGFDVFAVIDCNGGTVWDFVTLTLTTIIIINDDLT